MTREEAIEFIAQSVKSDVDMAKVADAIKTIEQEPIKNHLGVDCISREQALDLLCKKCPVYNCIQKCVSYKAIEKMSSVTPQEPRWIPVSERLPKTADCYAVTRKIGSDLIVDACFFDGINTWHNDNRINHERNYLTDIIAWMPLPKSYEPQESEDKA